MGIAFRVSNEVFRMKKTAVPMSEALFTPSWTVGALVYFWIVYF